MNLRKSGAGIPPATRAAVASVTMAGALLLLKTYAAWATGSVSMLGSLADTALDLLSSVVTLCAVRLAATPADHEHRYGHGKAEALAALFQVALVTASAGLIGFEAVAALRGGAPVADAGTGIWTSCASIVATMVLLAYQRRIIRQTGSVAIAADNAHYQADVVLSVTVMAALALDRFAGLHGADPLFGIGVACWLAFGAFRASRAAVDMLMDREWPTDRRAAFIAVASQQPGMLGMHDLRTRTSGSLHFAQFHMDVDPDLTVRAAHDLVEGIEARLKEAFPMTDVLIHIDPHGHVDTNDLFVEENVLLLQAA